MSEFQATAVAPVNIATLKYWGKRDPKLNLPTNSSISVTLDQNDLRALTTARASSRFEDDELWLNGSKEDVNSNPRTRRVIDELREFRMKLEEADPKIHRIAHLPLQIVSENNFPTAAGLASSAAGFAALVKALALLYELPLNASELSVYSRQGSGSACRSMFGGFVAWEMGQQDDGSDSLAVQIAKEEHWPNMCAVVLVVSASKKTVASTSGMQMTVKTSSLFQHRIHTVVPERFIKMKEAILARDFTTFANLTMADSNQFHAVCLDTQPPIFYLNDVSRAAIRTVEKINDQAGCTIAAYTFDAGPNCVIYYLKENEQAVLKGLQLPPTEGLPECYATNDNGLLATGIQRVIFTKVGSGPQASDEFLPEITAK